MIQTRRWYLPRESPGGGILYYDPTAQTSATGTQKFKKI
jgi:hypothetical protein